MSLNLKWKGGGLIQCAIRRTSFLHIGAPYKSPGDFSPGLSVKETPPYAWERLFEGLPRFPKLPHVEHEHFITRLRRDMPMRLNISAVLFPWVANGDASWSFRNVRIKAVRC